MNAIIIDDEPKAIELLKSYLEHFSSIRLTQTFRNGLKAFEFLSRESTDLVFLDINMPHISGISLSKMIRPETKIIFTTAYSEYAVESYEVAAVDYLLKPISLARFTQAISKVLPQPKVAAQPENTIILVKSGRDLFRISTSEIRYLEKDGNYITYHLDNRKILARASIMEALTALPDFFVQTHKSFIVNTQRISSLQKESLFIVDSSVPVSPTFRAQLLQILRA